MKSLALIGAGRWGKNLARNFFTLGALHTLCEREETKRVAILEQCPGVLGEEDFRKVLDNPDITKVAIATPGWTHYNLAKQALQAGKDVLVEKPLAMEAEQARELYALAEASERILMVGHILRYHPAFVELLKLAEEGALGKISYAYSNRLGLQNAREGENVLWDYAPHDLSMLLPFFQEETPSKISATGCITPHYSAHNVALIHLEFGKNRAAHIHISWTNPFKEHKLVVVGSEAIATFDDTLDWPHKLCLRRVERAGVLKDEEWIAFDRQEPLKEECRHFLESCETRKRARTCASGVIPAIEVIELACRQL